MSAVHPCRPDRARGTPTAPCGRAGRRTALALLLATAAVAAPVAAQDTRPPVAPYLEPGHWTLDALRRLEALGLLGDGYDPGAWMVDRSRAEGLFEAAHGASHDARTTALIEGYLRRFRAEFRGPDGDRPGRGRVAGTVGYHHADGRVLTAVGWPPDVDGWPPLPEILPTPVPRESRPSAGIDASGYAYGHWAGRARLTVSADGLDVDETYLTGGGGRTAVWLGRRRLRLGPGSGVVLGGGRSVDGIGLEAGAFRLPWVLDHLGAARLRTAVVRLGEVAPYDHPLLWTFRGSIQPHPRVTIGLNRAAMVPGPEEMSAEWLIQLPLVLIGKHPDGELNRQDNQIASVDLAYNAPIPGLPLLLHLEWGFEDSAGAWKAVPGVVVGAYLPATPGLPWLGLGVERASFAEMCCGNPWWYRHRGFTGGWTDDRRPLGHPLGGHGTEWSLTADASLLAARLLITGEAFHRDRGIENLFAPTRQGASSGGTLTASLFLAPRFDLRAELAHEWGDDWDRGEIGVFWSYLF